MEVTVRPERPGDAEAIRAVTAAAFTGIEHSAPPVDESGDPGEATLVEWLRADAGFLPPLSLVAEIDGEIVGHSITTRGYVDGAPALGLGPISVHPDRQRAGVGRALMRQTILSADAAGETLICLLGDPVYYSRFAFVDAASIGVHAPDPEWGPYFQALVLDAAHPRGRFEYAPPFARL